MQPNSGIPPIINVDPRPDHSEQDSGKTSCSDAFKSAFQDYIALYALNKPSTARTTLTREKLCRVIPLAFSVYVIWVFIFLIIEVSGGAGGTSSPAETRAATLFVIYFFFLLPMAFHIARNASIIQSSSIVTTFALTSFVLLAAEIGSVFATFGVCSETTCGIDSKNRGAKNVLETLFYLFFGIPPIVAAFQAAFEFEMEARITPVQLHRHTSHGSADRSTHRNGSVVINHGAGNVYGTIMHKTQSLPTCRDLQIQSQAGNALPLHLVRQNSSGGVGPRGEGAMSGVSEPPSNTSRELPSLSSRETSAGAWSSGKHLSADWGGGSEKFRPGGPTKQIARGEEKGEREDWKSTLMGALNEEGGGRLSEREHSRGRPGESPKLNSHPSDPTPALATTSSFVLGHLPRLPSPASRSTSAALPPPMAPIPTPPSQIQRVPSRASRSPQDARSEVESHVDDLINQFLDADQNTLNCNGVKLH